MIFEALPRRRILRRYERIFDKGAEDIFVRFNLAKQILAATDL